jgi:hypothetical protein
MAVFQNFGAFFHRPLRKPTVLLNRERFSRRHLHAYLLGEFFRAIYSPDTHVGAMQAFNTIGWLCKQPRIPIARPGEPKPEKLVATEYSSLHPAAWWRDGLSVSEQFESFLSYHTDHPELLSRSIDALSSETPISKEGLPALLQSARDLFHDAWNEWARDYETLTSTWIDLREESKLSVLNAIAHQANALWRKTVIEELAIRRFLPRYGFPIGLQSLTSPDFKHEEKEPVNLERDGILAVSEYVPGSVVLAGGRTYTSRGLVGFWGEKSREREFGVRLWKYSCLLGHSWYRKWQDDSFACAVPECSGIKEDAGKVLLLPKFGYSTAAWDPPSWSGDPERVGRTQIASTSFLTPDQNRIHTDMRFGGILGLKATLCEGGELLASNSGESSLGFAVCTKCGYAESEKKIGTAREHLPRSFESHIPLNKHSGTCWRNGEAPVLRNHHLAAMHVTDLIELDFTTVNHNGLTEAAMTTLGYALKFSGAEMLELDSREIGVTTCRIGHAGRWGLQLFDSAAGGAGHVSELFANGRDWFERALEFMFRDQQHHHQCVTACLRCLLSSASQADYEKGLVQREQTYSVLKTLLRSEDQLIAPEPMQELPVER